MQTKTGTPPDDMAATDSPISVGPDGYYWSDEKTGLRFGPFPTREKALTDMLYDIDETLEAGESLEEAEEELGIASWIDQETGLPAEGPVPRTDND